MFTKIILIILDSLLIIFDFVSDISVGIGLYQACHLNFAIISFTLSALPSVLIMFFLIVSCICPCEDRMTRYIKGHSGLYPGGLIGLIFARPLYTIVMRIKENCKKDEFGSQTRMGLKALEILSQSEVSLHTVIDLIVRAVGGAGESQPTFKLQTFFIMTLTTTDLIFNNFQGNGA